MKKIKLGNKDYALLQVDSTTYKLVGTWEHLRIGLIIGYPNNYSYITPEGGPCIALGDSFKETQDKKVVDIREVNNIYLVTIK